MRGVGGFRGLGFSIYILDLYLIMRVEGGFSIHILDFPIKNIQLDKLDSSWNTV